MFEVNIYLKHEFFANITQQCHNKLVSMKQEEGPCQLGHWSSSVLATEKQDAWQGRNDEEKH